MKYSIYQTLCEAVQRQPFNGVHPWAMYNA